MYIDIPNSTGLIINYDWNATSRLTKTQNCQL